MERKVVADDDSSFICVDYQPGTFHLNLHYWIRSTEYTRRVQSVYLCPIGRDTNPYSVPKTVRSEYSTGLVCDSTTVQYPTSPMQHGSTARKMS